MHPGDCPAWEYEDYPQYTQILGRQVPNLLIMIGNGAIDTLATAIDTRHCHSYLFTGLTPSGCEYYAGHYRGENLRCLQYYRVGVQSDPRVGIIPEYVLRRVAHLASQIETMLLAMDTAQGVPDATVSQRQKLRDTVSLVCRFHVEFLTIHPYANGNGHTARVLLTVMLNRYGYKLRRFPIDPRPEPPYLDLVKLYRDGVREPLEAYILSCLRK